MNDETYAFISDIKEKNSIVRSGGKKGRSRYGCKLLSDNLSAKEKRMMNGTMVSINKDRPMNYEKFCSLSAQLKKEYIQHIIDVHGGNTSRIAKLFDITEAQVKKLRHDLGIVSSSLNGFENPSNEALWESFVSSDNFLKLPMDWKTFTSLDKYDQLSYLNFLYNEKHGSLSDIADMLGLHGGCASIATYIKRKGIEISINRARRSKEEKNIWKEFVGKEEKQINDQNEEEMLGVKSKIEGNSNPATSDSIYSALEEKQDKLTFDDPVVYQEFEEINICITLNSIDDINAALQFIPKAKRGTISFKFGY